MGAISRADIDTAIKGATGDPSVGPVADIHADIVEAVDRLINGAPAKEDRVIKAKETPEGK